MTVDDLKKFAKNFSFQFTVVVIIATPFFLHLERRWDKLFNHEKELYAKEVALKQKEIELETKTKRDEAFNAALEKFNSEFGNVDLSTEIRCDDAYMRKYREAKTALDALEGMAKETGKYRANENFFREKRGWIHSDIGGCSKKGS